MNRRDHDLGLRSDQGPSQTGGAQEPRRLTRRRALTVGAGVVGSLAGCTSGPTFPDADIIAGPERQDVFEPTEVTVPVGEKVSWGFASAGHNVCCRPEDSDDVTLPAEADTFATYAPDESADESLVPRGETYEHTFDVAGRYTYVCIPHANLGMEGTIHVE